MRQGLVYGMPEAEYHAGENELSSTGAKLLLEAPAKYKYQIIGGNRVHKSAYDLGTAVHAEVLGTEARLLTYPEEHLTQSGNVSTKAETKAWAEQQRDNGFVLVSEKELTQIKDMAAAVRANPDAYALLTLDGHSEVSMFAECSETGVKLRSRVDRLPSNHNVIVDLKTTAGSADAVEFAKTIQNFGYDVQAGHYVDVAKYVTGEDYSFSFVIVEKTAPYLVNVVTLSDAWLEMGRVKAMEARKRFAHGHATGEWPGYSGNHFVEAPMFGVYDFQDKYESGDIDVA